MRLEIIIYFATWQCKTNGVFSCCWPKHYVFSIMSYVKILGQRLKMCEDAANQRTLMVSAKRRIRNTLIRNQVHLYTTSQSATHDLSNCNSQQAKNVHSLVY